MLLDESWSCGCRVITSGTNALGDPELYIRVAVCNHHVTIALKVLTQVESHAKYARTREADLTLFPDEAGDDLPF